MQQRLIEFAEALLGFAAIADASGRLQQPA